MHVRACVAVPEWLRLGAPACVPYPNPNVFPVFKAAAVSAHACVAITAVLLIPFVPRPDALATVCLPASF